MYYEINEDLCRRAHEQNHLYTDYTPGSTTASYRAAVDAFASKCEAAKQGCRPGHEARLDALADRYARRLAAYYNDQAANDARHVAWFVAGPSNYNMRAHEKWSRRDDALREEWGAIQRMADEISRAAGDPSTILSGDPEAVEQLRAKVERLTMAQETMKAANVHYRKHGTMDGFAMAPEAAQAVKEVTLYARGPYPTFALSNNRANLKRAQEHLSALLAAKEAAPVEHTAAGGVTYREDNEIMRVQLIFDGKPDADTRALLKSNGFRWAPSQNAWQRQLTANGRAAAKAVLSQLHPQPHP